MTLVYLASIYLAGCYVFGAYLLFRLLAGRRLRVWLTRKLRPAAAGPHATGRPAGSIQPGERRRRAA